MLKRFLRCLPIVVCLTAASVQLPPETKAPLRAATIPLPPSVLAPCDGCAKKPSYNSQKGWTPPYPWTAFTGQIAIITQRHNGDPDPPAPKDRVVMIWNLNAESLAQPNAEWGTASTPATQYYSDPRWTYQNIGEVFGLTLDNLGNIYAASPAT